MGANRSLAGELEDLSREWEEITTHPESPRSLMDVIEYSLGTQQKAEEYVNRLLAYFLDPAEPHGMGTEFLKAFLDGLPAECDFQEEVYDLSDVAVDDQVWVRQEVDGETVSTGRVDLVIQVPNEWFLMVELKFSAEDTQTEFYYRDTTHVGERSKDAFESRGYYLYLHQKDRADANEPNFANWTWAAFASDVLEPFIIEHGPRFPQRTVAQLREFNDDVKNISGMSGRDANDQEKIELYLEHYDAIADVSETFDDRWADFTDEWGARLGELLERDGLGSYSAVDEDLTAVELADSAHDHRAWKFRTSSSDWGMIFKDGWWRHMEDLEGEIYGRADDRNDVRIGFHHRLERNRDFAVGKGTLKVYFRNMGANDQTFIDEFADTFNSRTSEIGDHLPSRAEITGRKDDMLVATYDIEMDEDGSFFDAYIESLHDAFVELVAENEALISTLDDIYTKSIQDVYGVSITSE